MLIDTDYVDRKTIRCAVAGCVKVYHRRCDLRMHMRNIHEQVPNGENIENTEGGKIQCPICQKSFFQKSNLRTHSQIHTGDQPFQCKYCDKAFAFLGNKTDHERRHINDRYFYLPSTNNIYYIGLINAVFVVSDFSGVTTSKDTFPAPKVTNPLRLANEPIRDRHQLRKGRKCQLGIYQNFPLLPVQIPRFTHASLIVF